MKIITCAECGHNFNGSIRLAKLMIEEAKKCKADIVKFQLYDTDRIKKFYQSRYAELKFSELTFEDAIDLKEHADIVGIEFMASAFDTERVEWLEKIGVKRHKIASRSIFDQNLIKAMEKTKKPLIASLGDWGQGFPKFKADFLYCVAEYPACITEDIFPKTFDKYTGFSDHTIGTEWARKAVERGATIIEKHFTLDKRLPGHNQDGSADPTELKDFVQFVKQYERSI